MKTAVHQGNFCERERCWVSRLIPLFDVLFLFFCFFVFLDSKCTYTRNGKRKRETECRKKESAEKGAKTEGQGRAMKRSPVLFSNELFCDQVVVLVKEPFLITRL